MLINKQTLNMIFPQKSESYMEAAEATIAAAAGGSAGPKKLETEPNIGHLKCQKPVCDSCARRAE